MEVINNWHMWTDVTRNASICMLLRVVIFWRPIEWTNKRETTTTRRLPWHCSLVWVNKKRKKKKYIYIYIYEWIILKKTREQISIFILVKILASFHLFNDLGLHKLILQRKRECFSWKAFPYCIKVHAVHCQLREITGKGYQLCSKKSLYTF